MKSRPSFSAWGPKPRDATAARKNNHPIRRTPPRRTEASNQIDDSIIDSWQIPKFNRFSHIEIRANLFLDDAITKLGPFRSISSRRRAKTALKCIGQLGDFFLFCLSIPHSFGSVDIWKRSTLVSNCTVLQVFKTILFSSFSYRMVSRNKCR